jgi:hypothetical protein
VSEEFAMPDPSGFRELKKDYGEIDNASWPTLATSDNDISSATSSKGGDQMLDNSYTVALATPSEAATPTTLVEWPMSPINNNEDKVCEKWMDVKVNESISPTSTSSQEPPLCSDAATWRDLLNLVGPVSGLAAIVLAVIQLVASYAVLQASHGALVSTWKWQPQVYLAILTAVANKALAFAVVQGTVVTWWLHALQGTTLARMHRDWSYGYAYSSEMDLQSANAYDD